jgi:hypothetical protein
MQRVRSTVKAHPIGDMDTAGVPGSGASAHVEAKAPQSDVAEAQSS